MFLSRLPSFGFAIAISVVLSGCSGQADAPAPEAPDPSTVTDPAAAGLPNPTSEVVSEWGPLPDNRTWGSTAGVDIDPHDGNVWAYDRCGASALGGGCAENLVDPAVSYTHLTLPTKA